MSNNIIINHDGRLYTLDKLPYESPSDSYARLWKIIQHKPQTDYVYENLIKISVLCYYKEKYQCKYSDVVENLIALFNDA